MHYINFLRVIKKSAGYLYIIHLYLFLNACNIQLPWQFISTEQHCVFNEQHFWIVTIN